MATSHLDSVLAAGVISDAAARPSGAASRPTEAALAGQSWHAAQPVFSAGSSSQCQNQGAGHPV